MPAFRHATRARLAALVSGDDAKARQLAAEYGIERTYSYRQFDKCLSSGEVQAVYIALPNHMHVDYAVRTAAAGVNVLCDKPMAITEKGCEEMIDASREHNIKLMIAYRLHFEPANLAAIEVVQSGRIGEPRYFESAFSLQVAEGNIRLKKKMGGGTLYDIGIYCINAARYLFRAEPEEVWCATANNGEPRFSEVETTAGALLRFPGGRVAAFTCSFGAAGVTAYRVAGTKGDLRVEPAYDFREVPRHVLTIDGHSEERSFPATDQFAVLLDHFAECIQTGRDPEPGGYEGLADVRIIRALYQSAAKGRPVKLEPFQVPARPSPPHTVTRASPAQGEN